MRTVIVIPARYASSRFPGKPLAKVGGVSMLQRVWAIAKAVPGVDGVMIATDDERIREAASSFGAESLMTPNSCRTGTERAAACIPALKPRPDVIMNLQGDAVLTPPWVIAPLIKAMAEDETVAMATLATALDDARLAALRRHKKTNPASGTTVVLDKHGDALYFSKHILPFQRESSVTGPVYRHIGIYGYRTDTLKKLVNLAETPVERVEGLEQLRALYHGIPIRVASADYQGRTHWSIDSPDDLAAAERLIAEEGELLPAYDGGYRMEG